MAKSKPTPLPKKLAGLKIAFVGKFGYGKYTLDGMKKVAQEEGGTVVDGEKVAPDYLIEGAGVGGNPPSAVAKIQKKHPQVAVLDQAGFFSLILPMPAEFLELMKTGPHGHEFWSQMQERLRQSGAKLDLSGNDFRNLMIGGTFYGVDLDNSDFRGASLTGAYFDKLTGAKLDGAKFDDGSFTQAVDCSLKNVTMRDVRWNPAEFTRCDFTGSKLSIRTGSYTTAIDCTFKKVDFSGADLGRSKFVANDFSGATLTGTKLEHSDFTRAILAGADLSRADLRHVKFENADLRKAKFKDAILSGADFSGAAVDGADFTGATLSGVILDKVDTAKAKNLTAVAARTAGPHVLELSKVAHASKRFDLLIELELGKDEWVVLNPSLAKYGNTAYANANYTVQKPNESHGNYADAPSFEQGMLNLADLWSRGTPKFDTVKVTAKQCPLKGKELQDLAIAAWHEALGLAVPTADELAQQQEEAATATAGLRETMIAELEAGPAGVKKWNERTDKERAKLGKLRKHDFSGAKLAGLYLTGQDLEGSTFDGANLKKAIFEGVQLKAASFVKADLHDGSLALSKCPEASFEGATLTKCNLRAASFRRTNFQNAYLSKSDFSYSDLGGADFTGATLTGVVFSQTKFDEKTIFPPDFVPPDGLVWRGVGVRPGTAPPPTPPPTGSVDLDSFLAGLNTKVDLARMKKAGSMLKSEKFQLFCDVKPDSVVGIVKSQTSKDLVYSCRLASDGAFSCCTQNLRPCGGLQGALCKHLLVLIVGLTKAGQLDPATVDHWIDTSRSQKPAIDVDLMSETFLRYKGAEAGELDWRPTETLPEDFYAM